MSIFTIVLFLFGISQVYWGWRGYRLLARWVSGRGLRLLVALLVLALDLGLFAFNFGYFGRRGTAIHLTLSEAVLVAPFLWWVVSSLVAFLVMIPFLLVRAVVAIARRIASRFQRPSQPDAVPSPARREFLGRTANAVAVAPFVAGGYGLLYGRLNLETSQQPAKLPRLPKAFEGFKICQLSDIHIGPFMPAEEIRRYVAIANAQKADMVVLTGDYVTFDPATQQAVVEALSGLRAPFGVYGCLGNHDAWSGVEDSISALFQQTGVRMLRGQALPIAIGGESFQLIGVDFQSRRRFGPSMPVAHLLADIEGLIAPDRTNILLSHNPDTFDRAAELGIDLSLAGHTHGGQAALEFISPQLAPSRLVTPYVQGWFRKPGGQLYVNRGIGTIGVPIRIGAPPEITVYHLQRG